MPLLDHFRPPLSVQRHWEAFHAQWASSIANALNGELPPGYFAEPQVHVGSRVEIDVATFDRGTSAPAAQGGIRGGGTVMLVAPAASAYSPPAPSWVMPIVFPDVLEVRVYSSEAGPVLVAAVELVSPSNKDRPDHRRAFAAKCAAYLQEGVGLAIVDVVTNRSGNLHNEIVKLIGAEDRFLLSSDNLYAVAYRAARVPAGDDQLENQVGVWPAGVAVGSMLPMLPLFLDKGLFAPLDLEGSYADARQRNRLDE